MLYVCSNTVVLAQESCPGFEGTWEYVSDTAEGMFISTDKHMVALQVKKNRAQFDNYQLTDAEKAEAFSNTYFAGAGSWSCEGNVATYTILHHAHPNLEGSKRKYEFEFEGDTIKIWRLNPEGERGALRLARKVDN